MLKKIKRAFKRNNEEATGYEAIKSKLHPRIRPASFFEVYEMSAWELADDSSSCDLFFAEYDSDLAIGAVLLDKNGSKAISMADIDDWNIDPNIIIEKSLDDFLDLLPNETFEEARQGLWISTLKNMNDSTLLYAKDLIKSLDIKGLPVAFIPNRDVLLITGSEDQENLSFLIEETSSFIQEHGAISGQPYILKGDSWHKFSLNNTHSCSFILKQLIYQNKKAFYSQFSEYAQPENITIQDFEFQVDDSTKTIFSYTIWKNNGISWFPKTDYIVIAPGDSDNKIKIEDFKNRLFPWDIVMEFFKEQAHKLDSYNEYWEINADPTNFRVNK